ncbi:hypothetical protein REPUB_Repub16aG0100100 [Reevesia pubescens]
MEVTVGVYCRCEQVVLVCSKEFLSGIRSLFQMVFYGLVNDGCLKLYVGVAILKYGTSCTFNLFFPCRTSGLTSKERFHRRPVAHFHGIMLVKSQSGGRKSRCSQLIKSKTNYSASELRCSNQLSRRKEKNFSSCSSNRRRPKAISNFLEQWSQSQIVKVVGLLACAYLVISSAGAVDA